MTEYYSKADFFRKTCHGVLQKASWWKEQDPVIIPIEQGVGVKLKTDYTKIFSFVRDHHSACDYMNHGTFFGSESFKYDITDYVWALFAIGGYSGYEIVDCLLLEDGQFYSLPYGAEVPYKYIRPSGIGLIDPESSPYLYGFQRLDSVAFRIEPYLVDNQHIYFYITRDLTYCLDSGYFYELVVIAQHKDSLALTYGEFKRLSPMWRIYMRPFTIPTLAFCHDTPREYMDFFENVIPQRGL